MLQGSFLKYLLVIRLANQAHVDNPPLPREKSLSRETEPGSFVEIEMKVLIWCEKYKRSGRLLHNRALHMLYCFTSYSMQMGRGMTPPEINLYHKTSKPDPIESVREGDQISENHEEMFHGR